MLPPITGGQCSGKGYWATFSHTIAYDDCTTDTSTNPYLGMGYGPISFRAATENVPSNGLCPGFTYNRVYVDNASGSMLLLSAPRGVKLNSLTLNRDDGLPDNC